jgi:hypothetical protein
LAAAISANSVQAAPVGLAKTISVVAIAQGAMASGSMLTVGKGLLKLVFTASAGMFASLAPLLGSVFFHLKAEIENTRSPRERQFIVRMIWFRFTVAFLLTAVPIVIAVMMPSIFEQRGVIEFGFAGFCFLGAVETAARMVYFHRRRRQIQIEDGTWEDSGRGEETKPAGLLADLSDKTSKANRYSAIAAVYRSGGMYPLRDNLDDAGDDGWILDDACSFCYGVDSLLSVGFANWRQRPRFVFDARFATLVKFVSFWGVLSLLLLDLSWAHGRLPQSDLGVIVSNIAVVLAYAGLIRVLARWHRQPAALRH